MKAVWFVGILLLTQAYSQAGDTAYQALRLIGKSNPDYLNHVIEARGTNGVPQPQTWTIVIEDQSARGGVREFEIAKGHVVSEHTPVHAYAGAVQVMDFKHLNLDSQGAFTVANQEATKHNTGFNSVDYQLHANPQNGAPQWVLRLIDVNRTLVGTITISADSGTIENTTGFDASATPIAANTPPPRQPANQLPPPNSNPQQPPPSSNAQLPPPNNGDAPQDDDPPNPNGVGHQINKGLHRFGADIQQFFTGKRTWDQKFQNEP